MRLSRSAPPRGSLFPTSVPFGGLRVDVSIFCAYHRLAERRVPEFHPMGIAPMPLELSPPQVALLQRLAAQGFHPFASSLYANAIGVRKGSCAALLGPVPGGGLRVFGEACYLVEGKLSVRVTRGGRQWFVWKDTQIEATGERLAELQQFSEELGNLLHARA